MTRPRTARVDPLRLALVTAAFLVTSAWMFSLFLFLDADLGFLIAASGLHVLVGLALVFAACHWRCSMPFAFFVVLTPIVHYLGASLDTPWCFLPFAGPSVVISAVFAVEVMRYLHPMGRDDPRFTQTRWGEAS